MENVQTAVLSNEQKRDFVESVAIVLRDIIPDPDVRNWIGCQFALESNYGQSELVKKCCNYCGMRQAQVRPTSRIKHLRGEFSYYDSFESCVLDYILWFTYFGASQFNLRSLIQYKDFVKKEGYCPCDSKPNYIERIDAIYNSLY